jgi:hypothetical protein
VKLPDIYIKIKKQFHLNNTPKEELHIIITALADPDIQKISPIAHLVDKDPNGTAFGDSCLDSWGGWSTDMKFWWMLKWPQEIRDCTLQMIRSAKDGDRIAINEMEYATSIVNFAASMHYWIIQKKREGKNIPYPTVLGSKFRRNSFWSQARNLAGTGISTKTSISLRSFPEFLCVTDGYQRSLMLSN